MTISTLAPRRAALAQIPNQLSGLRLALVPVLVGLAWLGQPVWFVAVLALLDLTFCAALVGQRLSGGLALIAYDVVVFVLVPLGLFWLAVRAVADARKGKAGTAVFVGACVLAAFVLHKRVDLFPRLFPDVAALAEACRFGDCGHADEPDCAVRAALERGELDPRRWGAWLDLQRAPES